jgi:filamentous hemagglutinin family protein
MKRQLGRYHLTSLIALFSMSAWGAPVGPTVTYGSANISLGTNSTINFSGPVTIINWQSFNVAASESVNFSTSSVPNGGFSPPILANRIMSGSPSLLAGSFTITSPIAAHVGFINSAGFSQLPVISGTTVGSSYPVFNGSGTAVDYNNPTNLTTYNFVTGTFTDAELISRWLGILPTTTLPTTTLPTTIISSLNLSGTSIPEAYQPAVQVAFRQLVTPTHTSLATSVQQTAQAMNRIVVGNFNEQESQKDGNVKACR